MLQGVTVDQVLTIATIGLAIASSSIAGGAKHRPGRGAGRAFDKHFVRRQSDRQCH